MKSQGKISINTPCSEKWEKMLPQDRGRFCLTCEKIVIDFTSKSDQEILNHIKESNGNICGRFKPAQLDRELDYDKIPKVIPLWQKAAASLLFFIGVENAYASKHNTDFLNYDYAISKTDTDKNISKERKGSIETNTSHVGDTIKVRGRVVDDKTNEGLPFAVIKIIDTNIKVVADLDGYYSIKVTKEQLQSDLKIQIEVIGYYPFEDFLRIYNINAITAVEVVTNFEGRVFDSSVAGGVIFIEKIEKKWWQFWK